MAKQISSDAWFGFLSRLKQESYSGIATELSHELELKPEVDSVGLKALLLNSADKCIEGQERKAMTYKQVMDCEIILVALGLLTGYYGDMDGINGARLFQIKGVGERRIEYLKSGPYLRMKRGERYFSYDAIESDKAKKDAKKAIEQQDGRLLKKKLAVYLAGIKDIENYIKQSRQIYVNDGMLRLPKQRCFLEDVDFSDEGDYGQGTSSDKTFESAASAEQEQFFDSAKEIRENPEISQETVSTAPLAFGWGDNGSGRPSYMFSQIESGILEDAIVFNSISNSVIGNEKNFVGVREDNGLHAGKNNVWHSNRITVENGKTYIVRLYVHNNNPNGIRAVAKNVRAAIGLPYQSGKQIRVTGFIESSNAVPSRYWANVVFCSDDAVFHLEYIYDSASLENNELGRYPSIKVSDDIVTRASSGGILVNYDTLDGSVPGGYQYASYLTIRVKAVFDDPFSIEGKVRIAGSVDWGQSVKVKIGTVVEFYFKYRNISEVTHNRVTVRCTLPPSLRYVLGSTKVYNANFDGASLNDGVTTTGLIVGNYTPGSDVYIHFAAEIIDDNLKDGWNTLAIEAKCGVEQVVRHKLINIIVKK